MTTSPDPFQSIAEGLEREGVDPAFVRGFRLSAPQGAVGPVKPINEDAVREQAKHDREAAFRAMLETLRELHLIAADAQLRASYQKTALERISSLARAAISKAEGRSS